MGQTPVNKTQLSNFQRILLLSLSIAFVAIFFVFRNSFGANSSLETLARNSLLPEEALMNGKPTIIEFYADWCEVCQEMAPSIESMNNINKSKVNLVLLNVDNPRWADLIDKYDVNGIPQLNLFDKNGIDNGVSIGFRSENELMSIFNALINEDQLPSFSGLRKESYIKSLQSSAKDNQIIVSPRSHS